ncbi:hypothetical protein LCGC14_0749130 [marine sediment metagenome]|uniref:Uncharacterized protein n=1 Tax=marine sediment metagenome TaxID=412755 RepID=A0A0F9TBG7_9ZZZZ
MTTKLIMPPQLRDDIAKILKVHSPEGTDSLGLPEIEPNYVVQSPGTPVHFPGGLVVNMNRRERRRRGLYGSMVTRRKGIPSPPNIRKGPE